jgi:hypothetical protein
MERSLAMRATLAAAAVLALVGVWTLARPGHAKAGGDLLAGSPQIGTIRALVPRRGRDAGRLIVWVRVSHARGTPRALARERPETVHLGRVVVRVGDRSRVARQQFDLDGRRLAGGYHVRFPKAVARSAGAGRRAPVSVRVAQRVDLDSDGHSEDRALAATTRRVLVARPAISIEPRDGYFVNSARNSFTDLLQVAGGHVVYYSFVPLVESPCGVGPAHHVSAPIDPQTGLFSFADTTNFSDPPVTVTAQGDFRDATSLVLLANVTVGGCTARVEPSSFSPYVDP